MIHITRGYSRDHRPAIKQVVVGLLTTYRSALPTWIQALNGNAADVRAVPELIKAYVQQFKEGREPYFVADSALYSEENLRALSEVKWVTRVPERIGLAKSLEEAISVADMRESPLPGYRFLEVCTWYGDVPQRWIIVHSEASRRRDLAALAEHKLRWELKARNESVPNQVGKPTRRPTMRRIFQVFEGIDVLIIHTPGGVERHITNLTDLHRRILHLLGPAVQKCYLGPT